MLGCQKGSLESGNGTACRAVLCGFKSHPELFGERMGVDFTKSEINFIKENEVCALATLTENFPHVVPVCYLFRHGAFYIVTDYETKKYKNILKDRKVALTIFGYKPARGILVQGNAEILESGEEFRKITAEFIKIFSWARADPWKEGESPILKIIPVQKSSWGLS
jgi:nitroimidazol reductase NimA-like FMN-containing flavoprotein (pyridoxamine 5'-phosphate oxidase superfamily)